MVTNSSKTERPVIVLFRQDLRMADNRALRAAVDSGNPIITVFIFDEVSENVRPIGGAKRWWLHKSLEALGADLEAAGGRLILRSGEMSTVVSELIKETDAETVMWNRRYDPPGRDADARMKAKLGELDIKCESFEGQLLHEPTRIKTKGGGPYKVYTPFWRAVRDQGDPRDPVARPRKLKNVSKTIRCEKLGDWNLLPTGPDWASGLSETWTPGEAGAHHRLRSFVHETIEGYANNRELPAVEGTSRLSPHLANGEITPYQIWHAISEHDDEISSGDLDRFRKEIVWREFCAHLLFHSPDLGTANFNEDFDHFPWRKSNKDLEAWQKGQTGYPIVDAGMRQLWQTGWMHNRVRMVVASFLVKHLLVDWRIGEAWFWDTLVDADPASNTANWQWVAGSGADASPYFRVFNPILQSEKFDARAEYAHRFVPELSGLPARQTHYPPDASTSALNDAGVKLGETYPVPVIDHKRGRERALEAYQQMREHK